MRNPPVEQRLRPDIASVVDVSFYGRCRHLGNVFCPGKSIGLPYKRERP